MSQSPKINYLNKNFSDFKQTLTDFAKTYFPTTYNDFKDADPGNMFMEMASYVGDVLSFYTDTQIQETFPFLSQEYKSLLFQAYVFGYHPKVTYASSVEVDIYQIVPSMITGSQTLPNMTYALIIPENTILTSTSTQLTFLTQQQVDFSQTDSFNISYINDNFFLLKQTVEAISAQIKSTTFTFGSPQKYQTVSINDSQIIKILDVVDSDDNKWTEVGYLAQSNILHPLTNNLLNNTNYNANDNIPYILTINNVPDRFVSRFQEDGSLKLEFGAGIVSGSDDTIIPNPDTIGLDIINNVTFIDQPWNKANFLYSKEYGVAPSNTTLTVRYLVGGGLTSNVPSSDITIINTSGSYFKVTPSGSTDSPSLQNDILTNITCNNVTGSFGGRDGDTIDELRLNTMYAYSTQLRAVTKQDYILRALSMPSDYGSIAKAYISQDLKSNNTVLNPLALSLYVLGYDSNKNLITASQTLKNNLLTYLSQYRMLTDGVSIKNAYIINIGVNFDITTVAGYNNRDILSNCISTLQNYFSIDKWQINQPMIISDIHYQLLQIKGVQSVVKLEVVNKSGGLYSQYGYDISSATRNGVIYPSLDPSIFEVKYLNQDLNGKTVSF